MKEELKHIDLIDKYLSNTLNSEEEKEVMYLLEKDKAFAKEVAVYQQMYKGIEAQSTTALKERLASYYEEYEKEHKSKPKGLYRTLSIGISLAACLLLGLFLYNEFGSPINFTKDPNGNAVEVDSTKVIQKDSLQETPIELVNENEQKESISKYTLPIPEQFKEDTQLAFGGLKRLSAASVQSLTLHTLFYTFKEDKLTLYGNPLISGLQFEILKKDLRYFLRYQDNYYSLEEVDKRTALVPIDLIDDVNDWKEAPSEEEIKVKIAGISEIKSTPFSLEVFYKEEKSTPIYLYQELSQKKRLTISGNLDFKNVVVYQIKRDDTTNYFIQSGKKIFLLDLTATEATPLKEISVMGNRDARLFVEKDTLIKKVSLVQ